MEPQPKLHSDRTSSSSRDTVAALYQRHGGAVYRYLVVMLQCSDTAQDLLQKLFVKILRTPEIIMTARQDIRSYLLHIARNEALDELRRRHARRKFDDRMPIFVPTLEATPFEHLQTREWAARLETAMFSLPVEQREAVQLHLYEDMSFETMAQLTGHPRTTLSTRYHTAIQKLKEQLHDFES